MRHFIDVVKKELLFWLTRWKERQTNGNRKRQTDRELCGRWQLDYRSCAKKNHAVAAAAAAALVVM